MKIKIFFMSLLIVPLFFSCKKEDMTGNGSINVKPPALLLNKLLTDNQSSNEYVYNDANLISEEKSKYDFTVNNYNDKNQLVSTDYYSNFDIISSDLLVYQAAVNNTTWVTPAGINKGGSISYEYSSDGKLSKSTYTPASGDSQSSDFSYDDNGRIGKQTLYWENSETGYIDYTYDDQGNLSQEVLYNLTDAGVPELSTTTLYEYDNKQNPFRAVSRLMIPGIYTNPNNVIKETCTISMQAEKGPDTVEVTETSYEYNEQGYPISRNGNVVYVYGS